LLTGEVLSLDLNSKNFPEKTHVRILGFTSAEEARIKLELNLSLGSLKYGLDFLISANWSVPVSFSLDIEREKGQPVRVALGKWLAWKMTACGEADPPKVLRGCCWA